MVNFQLVVNGVKFIYLVYGWGLFKGYVYQKVYFELFVFLEVYLEIKKCIENYFDLMYYVVIKFGMFEINVLFDVFNVVMWGVFFGKEIVQFIIVE